MFQNRCLQVRFIAVVFQKEFKQKLESSTEYMPMKARIIFLFLFIMVTIITNGQTRMDASINYIYNKPVSLRSQMLQSFMALARIKNVIENKMNKKEFSQKAASIPKSLQNNFDINISENNGYRIWTFKPKQNVSKKVILYLHGGAYILNILRFHWNFIEELLYKTNATIVVVDYPLAPDACYKDVYDCIEAVYLELLAEVSPQNIIFMGDSAGGGIALGFAQKLRNNNKPQPSQIILLSPWLDITMSNPDIIKVDKKDKLLGIKGLQMAGQAYAETLDMKDYKVSPIYGNFSGLGKVSVFIGTHDLFIADTRKMKYLMNKENIPINYFEYPKMFHVWALLTSLKESQHAIDQMALLINDENR